MEDRNQILTDIRKNCEEHVKTCRLIETRMFDAYCCALPDTGEVLMKDGIRSFPVAFGDKVERNRSKAAVERFLKQTKQLNPDNSTVQSLRVMGWKKAARLQRQRSEDLLAKLAET